MSCSSDVEGLGGVTHFEMGLRTTTGTWQPPGIRYGLENTLFIALALPRFSLDGGKDKCRPRGMSLSGKSALITGASAGIGRAIALELASRGATPILVARREERLLEVKERCERHAVNAHALVLDLARTDAVPQLLRLLSERQLSVDILINNAGYGPKESFSQTPWSEHSRMLQLMLVGVVELTHALTKGMLERGWGRIMHVASVAGDLPSTPKSTLYGPTKSFLIKFARGHNAELSGTGVHACALCPGYTYSEFHDVSGSRERVSRLPALLWMDADPVATSGVSAMLEGKAVHYPGTVNRVLHGLTKLLPASAVQRIIATRG